MQGKGFTFVKIGELALAEGQPLKAVLGSCVGVGILNKEAGKCGLIHCLLPTRPEKNGERSARYVDEGIPLLVEKLGLSKKDFRKTKAVVVGGANMNDGAFNIGSQNFEKALQILKELGIPLVMALKSDKKATQVVLDCADYTYEGKIIGQEEVA